MKKKINITYVSTVTSENKMNKIIQKSKNKPLQSIQKYHRLLVEGLVCNNCNVTTLTAIPMSRKISSKIVWKEKKEVVNDVQYEYIPFLNFPIIRQFCIGLFTFGKVIKKCLSRNKEEVFICDLLNTTIATTTLLIAKLFKKKCIAIVTDLPRDIGGKQSIAKKINEFFQNKYDAYILLTEKMNEVVNQKRRPYVVIEGIVDGSMQDMQSNIEQKYMEKVCIYAGGLYQKYGVECLIQAFLRLPEKDVRLHLYGEGELVPEIQRIQDERIKYFGVLPNKEVVQEEIKATLLINPRFTNEEYTKYSFPSKNMEYMSTGTPVITTKLPGMPEEYKQYVYLFEDESIDGVLESLTEVLKLSNSELWEKGKVAKAFVMKNKNHIIQSKKVIDVIKNIMK